MHRLPRALVASVFSFSLLAAAGCGGSVATPEATSSASAAATRAPVAPQAHGVVRAIGAALGEVPLRPDQRTEIEKLASDAEARHAQAAAARKDLVLAVAAQVDQGTIDRAALQPKIDALGAAVDAARPADRAALERLHAILDPDQRVAFVNALEAHMHEHMAGPHPEGHERGGMGAWAHDLNLTDAQKQQIHDAMRARFAAEHGDRDGDHDDHGHGHHGRGPDGHGGMGHGKQVLEAFKSDHFVLDEIAPAGDAHAKAQKMEEHMLGMIETVLPILTPEQRTIAAQKLRDHANGADADGPMGP